MTPRRLIAGFVAGALFPTLAWGLGTGLGLLLLARRDMALGAFPR
jgi:hypothetical protein